jgi:hypothetical protein
LHDVSEPQPLALPKYQGELYIYVALVMGAIWMFSSVPLIFLFGLVVVSDDRGGEWDAACCDINALCFVQDSNMHAHSATAADELHKYGSVCVQGGFTIAADR